MLSIMNNGFSFFLSSLTIIVIIIIMSNKLFAVP